MVYTMRMIKPQICVCILIIYINLGPVGYARASGDMLGSFRSNSRFGKRSGARVMTIFVSHVGPHLPNIEYFEVYEGI